MKYLGFTGIVVDSPIAGRASMYWTHFETLNGWRWGILMGMN